MKPADLPTIVDNLITDQTHEREIWIRPERIGTRYTVEWTALDYDREAQDWIPRSNTAEQSEELSQPRRSLWQLLNRLTAMVKQRMPSFDVDRIRINVFPIQDTYLFKHYFEQDDVFSRLRQYYNESDYRFEVPADELADVQTFLDDQFVELTVVEDPEQYCVVKRKYTEHPDVLFKASVLQREHQDYNLFLMKDQLSVEQAVNHGATRLADTDLDVAL